MIKHQADKAFWYEYHRLPVNIQRIADEQFELMKADPRHRSLRLKRIRNGLWSARITDDYRAIAWQSQEGFVWTWIGKHDDYENLLKRT